MEGLDENVPVKEISPLDALGAFIDATIGQIGKHWTSQNGPRSAYTGIKESILGFVHAIDWSEPWIIALIAFHILLFTLAVKRRSSTTTQMALFLFAMLGVFSAEMINSFLARHCARFASQQYFDFDGVFISTLWSGPLLLMSTMILANSLFSLSGLLVKWKKAELRYRARMAQKKPL